MKGTVLSALTFALESMLRNQVYVVGAGRLTAGLKRRGGLGFLPKRTLSREHLFLKSLDFKGKTVYDVGGFIGLVTMFFAREVGEGGRVVTFEPNPQNYDAILDHIELNGFTNVRVIKTGLGSKRDTVEFVVSDRLPARGTADPRRQEQFLGRKDVRVFQIEVNTMDNEIVVSDLPEPDFVKIDVEGLGIDVLRGMPQTIRDCRPEMLIELHGTSEREIVEFLWSYGYEIYHVEDGIDITPQNIDMIHGHLYAH
jgi:FkbM family methyltransferase